MWPCGQTPFAHRHITEINHIKVHNEYREMHASLLLLLLLLLHPFNGLFSRTTWVSQYEKGKTSLDSNEARDGGVLGDSGISRTICKQSAPCFRQITTPTSQQCQSTKGLRLRQLSKTTNQMHARIEIQNEPTKTELVMQAEVHFVKQIINTQPNNYITRVCSHIGNR